MADTVINGTDLLLYKRSGVAGSYTYQATGHSKSHSLSISMSARDSSSKASGVFSSRESGRLDVSGSAEGLAVYADTVGFNEMLAMVNTRELVFLVFAQNGDVTPPINETTPDLAKFYAQGYFYLTSVELSAPDQDNVTYSISFELANGFEIQNLT